MKYMRKTCKNKCDTHKKEKDNMQINGTHNNNIYYSSSAYNRVLFQIKAGLQSIRNPI